MWKKRSAIRHCPAIAGTVEDRGLVINNKACSWQIDARTAIIILLVATQTRPIAIDRDVAASRVVREE